MDAGETPPSAPAHRLANLMLLVSVIGWMTFPFGFSSWGGRCSFLL
jgi:hypothetical protein